MLGRGVVSLFCLFVCLFPTKISAQNYGVAYAQGKDDASSYNHYCIIYNPDFQRLPLTKHDAELLPVNDVTPDTLCSEAEPSEGMMGAVTTVARGNCTFSEKAFVVQNGGGRGMLVVSKTRLIEPGANRSEDYNNINITVGMIGQEDFLSMKRLGRQILVKLYAPVSSHIDYNILVIWLVAVFTVMVGAYWSGLKKHHKYLRRRQAEMDEELRDDQSKAKDQEDDGDSVDVTPTTVMVAVVMMCGMLLALYFFYDYLVYAVIGLFTIAASFALYSCIASLLSMLPLRSPCSRLAYKVPGLAQRVEVRRVLLALCCLGVGIFWAVERKASYAWVLQDILGVAFCINMMKTIHMPNLKACTILLSLLFVYDVFFVFITPLFTKTGESVMVEVATGGSSRTGEELPMVVKVPRFEDSGLAVCSRFSMLGFGDILVPGLLVSFCHGFDLKVQSKKIYFFSVSVAYGLGLIITFVALALMKTGQPALLYLVPCTLITTFLIGCCRKEVSHMWKGDTVDQKPRQVVAESSTVTAETEEPSEVVTGGNVEQQQLLINR